MTRVLLIALFCVVFATSGSSQPGPSADSLVPFPGDGDAKLARRIALVIGVEHYRGGAGAVALNDVTGVPKDVTDMTALLKSIGFEDVKTVSATPQQKFIDKRQIIQAVADLKARARKIKDDTGRGAIVLIYFSGHGLSYDSKNYLLPSDFFVEGPQDLSQFGIDATELARRLDDAEPELKLIVADACRNNARAILPVSGGVAELKRGFSDFQQSASAETDLRLGKHSAYIFAAFDNSLAFGDGDLGGQFTAGFVRDLKRAFNDVKARPNWPSKPSLDKIMNQLKIEMGTSSSAKGQIPKYDGSVAFEFIPFTTRFDYESEMQTFRQLETIPQGAKGSDWLKSRVCDYKDMLNQFSWYSYFAPKLRREIRANSDVTDAECERLRDGLRPASFDVDVQDISASPSRDRSGSLPADPAVRKASFNIPLAQPFPLLKPAMDAPSGKKPATPRDLPAQPNSDSHDITFGDLRQLVEKVDPKADLGPIEDFVTLETAFIAKKATTLRTAPGDKSVVADIPAGTYVEFVGSDRRGKWLQVRFGKDTGYVPETVLEPALVPLTHDVKFKDDDIELAASAKAQLAAVLKALDGLAVLETKVEYPYQDGRIGFARAIATRSYFESVTQAAAGGRETSNFILVRRSRDETVLPGTIRIRLIALPLNVEVRKSIAKIWTNTGLVLKAEGPKGGAMSIEAPRDSSKPASGGDRTRAIRRESPPEDQARVAAKVYRF